MSPVLLCLLPVWLPLWLSSPTPCAAFWNVQTENGAAEVVDHDSGTHNREADTPVEYGVDVSFPMHHHQVSNNYAWLPHNTDSSVPTPPEYRDMSVQPLGNMQARYDTFLQECVEYYGKKGERCVSTEQDRIAMSLRQPQSMQNYTELGYKKIRAPEAVYKLIREFWDRNNKEQKMEQWGVGNTYTNNWKAPTYMVSVEDKGLRGGGYVLKQKIWDAARDTIQEWTGEELTQCSLYGIRVYKHGAVLAPHVDRLPLVSSAIINVASEVDEPWPLEVIGHDGRAQNVTMEPGDMVLYESHSVIHGRPFPLKGWVANLFVHFEPTGHSLRHSADVEDLGQKDVHERYKDALARGFGGHENENSGLPPYLLPGTPEENHWRKQHPSGHKSQQKSFATGTTTAHVAAQKGSLGELKAEINRKKDAIHARDENGWTPLHEGARSGHLDIVKYLVELGADVNATTSSGGGTALWWAKETFGAEGNPVIDFLESMGALNAGPEL
jgi:prolyl 4-hydroxylase